MHFDPYESKASKRRRITSDICAVIVVALMIFGIIALFFQKSPAVKYRFEQLSLKPFYLSAIDEGQSEFDRLGDRLAGSGQIVLDDDFKKSYPNAYALINMDGSVYDPERPFSVVEGGHIAIAQCAVSNKTDYRDLAVTVIDLEQTQGKSSFTLSLGNIREYTVRYNTRDSSVPLIYLDGGKGTRLDIFKISVKVEDQALISSRYRMKVKGEFDADRAKAKLYHQIIFDPVKSSYHHPGVSTGDGVTYISIDQNAADKSESGAKSAQYNINLSNKNFYVFDSADFIYDTESADTSLVDISFN